MTNRHPLTTAERAAFWRERAASHFREAASCRRQGRPGRARHHAELAMDCDRRARLLDLAADPDPTSTGPSGR